MFFSFNEGSYITISIAHKLFTFSIRQIVIPLAFIFQYFIDKLSFSRKSIIFDCSKVVRSIFEKIMTVLVVAFELFKLAN